MERRAYALALAYCGEPFAGWQRQPGRPTVQAAVEAALAAVGLGPTLRALSAAARTDAGVHARRQLLTFRVRETLRCPALLVDLNAALPRAVRATGLWAVGPSFHARASAHLREYRYRVQLGGALRRFSWSLPDRRSLPEVPERFDLGAAREFLAGLLGRRDRTPHTTRPEGPKATTLLLAELDERPGGRLLFRFKGDGFTRHLVRNWVWAAAARGCGLEAAEVAARESPTGWKGPRAPGHGLILWDLIYADAPELFG